MKSVARRSLPPRVAAALKKASDQLANDLTAAIGAAYKTKGIQKVLRDEMFVGCCCFCEVGTEASSYGQVEHYRPKALTRFRHLAYTWENLIWACGRCNLRKSDHWADETPLLNPCDDEPRDHLTWNEAVVMGQTARGKYTEKLLDLNGKLPGNLTRYEHRRDHLMAARLASEALGDPDPTKVETARELLARWLSRGPYRGMLEALGLRYPGDRQE